MTLRVVEDMFDDVGAEHSLPFRRFLVFAPSFIARLPAGNTWRDTDVSPSHSSSSAAKETSSNDNGAHADEQQQLNRQIVEAQSRLDRILEDIAAGESMLAAVHLKIHSAEAQLQQLEGQVAAKEAQFVAFNLVQPVRAKGSAHNSVGSAGSSHTEPTAPHDDPEDSDSSSEESDSDAPLTPTAEKSQANSTASHEPASSEPSVDHSPEQAIADTHHEDHSASEASTPADTPRENPQASPVVEENIATADVEQNAPQSPAKVEQEVAEPAVPTPVEAPVEETTPTIETDKHVEESAATVAEPVTTAPAVEEPAYIEATPAEPSPAVEEPTYVEAISPPSDVVVNFETSDVPVAVEEAPATPKKRRKHKDRSSSTAALLTPDASPEPSSEKIPRSKRKDKKDREKTKSKEKLKEKHKEKEKRASRRATVSATPPSPNSPVTSLTPSKSNRSLKDDVTLEEESPSPRVEKLSPRPASMIVSSISDSDLPGEKLSLIDKTFFASIDVKLQAIIDGLQPHQHILDLTYFNLVVYIQGLNAQLMAAGTHLPTVSTVPASLATPVATKKPSVVQLQPRISSKASVIGIPSVSISPSSPTPPTMTTVRTPLVGFLVSGPYFTLATGDMINSLGDSLVQCLNNLLILIQDSRVRSPNVLASLCSSWKSNLYQSICTAYHSIRHLIKGITSDRAQYFFPATPAPPEDPMQERGLSSVTNAIVMGATNVNDEYMPDPIALQLLTAQQQADSQLLTRNDFIRLFGVYFGVGVMENMLYILDPWSTQSIPMKRFAEFLRLYGTVAGASCYRQFRQITSAPGFQGYLTEGVVLTLLEQQAPGTYCLWFNKVRPKFGVLNLSWFDSTKEIVSSTTLTISSSITPGNPEAEGAFSFGFDYEGLSVTAPTLQELLDSLASIDEPPTISKPFTPQFPRSSAFHGDMDSPEAEALLSKEADGTLLFRLSSRRGSLAVSYVFRGKVGHTLLKIGTPDSYEYSGQIYNSIADVIQGHAQIFKYVFDHSSLSRTNSPTPVTYL